MKSSYRILLNWLQHHEMNTNLFKDETLSGYYTCILV
jgi:hypothetical protein